MTTNPLLLITIGAALATVAGQLWRNRASVRARLYRSALWTGYTYGYDHGQRGSDRAAAWHALANTAPGAQPGMTPPE
jgi:hypothetical protein